MVTGVASAMAERLKEDGNNCFKKERFGAAIDAYTEVHGSHSFIRVFVFWVYIARILFRSALRNKPLIRVSKLDNSSINQNLVSSKLGLD